MRNDCIVIALEGPDKMGKTTQAKALTDALASASYQKIPAKDELTYEKIYQMLSDGEAVEHPHYFQSLNGLNRMIWQKEQLPKLAKTSKYIILDRWRASTIVYGMGIGMTRRQCDIIIKDLVKPHLTFVFTGTPFNRDTVDDAYEKDNDLQASVREGYRSLCKEDVNAIAVGDIGSPKEVTEFMLKKIEEFENGK